MWMFTFMCAWNRPVATVKPVSLNAARVAPKVVAASSGGAASVKLGRRPRRVSA